jgi:CheY-like chemotaxis protein
MFQNNLPVHNHHLEIEWIIDTHDLVRGTHVTFPDAVMLIVISTVAHMSTESNSLGFHFSFEQVQEDDMEYPELITKMLEGRLSIKVFAKDSRAYPNRILDITNAMDVDVQSHSAYILPRSLARPNNASVDTQAQQQMCNPPPFDCSGVLNNAQHHAPDVLSKQNFLSIDKILRAINGSSREYVDDILLLSTIQPGASSDLQQISDYTKPLRAEDPHTPEFRMIHEFLVPCKILLSSVASPSAPAQEQQQQQQHMRFFRPPTKNTMSHPHAALVTETTIPASAPSLLGELSSSGGTAAAIMSQSNNANNSGSLVPPPINTGSSVTSSHAQQHRNSPHAVLNAVSTASKSDDKVMHAPSPSQQHQASTTTAASSSSDARQLRVLVVEDTIPVQKLLTRWLQNQGCKVTCASNGKIGLDQLTSQVFDIAFVDFLMVRTCFIPSFVVL